jgi:hypothetical protein
MSTKTPFWQNHTFILALITIAIALAFIGYIAPNIQAIVTTPEMPTWEVQLIVIAKLVTNVFPPTILMGFGWSLFGYLREKAGDATVTYDLTRLAQTALWFIGIATPIAYSMNNTYYGTGIASGFLALKAVINQFVTASTPATFTIKIVTPATGTQSVPGTTWEEVGVGQGRIDALKAQGYTVTVISSP